MQRIKLSKNLYDMGMKVAAVATLCQDERVFAAMLAVMGKWENWEREKGKRGRNSNHNKNLRYNTVHPVCNNSRDFLSFVPSLFIYLFH